MPIDLFKAVDIVAGATPKPQTEYYDLNNINRHISAEQLYAPSSHPPYDRSQMDGIAYNGAEADKTAPFRILQHLSAAESYDGVIAGNDCVRISTGAQMPEGADIVTPVENLKISGEFAEIVDMAPQTAQYIEKKGAQIKEGDLILPEGVLLDPWYVETLASLRINSVKVLRMPHLGILSTGSEITGQFSDTGSIVNSNYYALSCLLRRMQVTFGYMGVVADDKQALRRALKIAVGGYDAVVTFGGTAKGRYDLMESVVRTELRGDILVNGVQTTPGRTFRFAMMNKTPLFILPGTPKAALVCSEIFLTSWLLGYQRIVWRDMLKECRLSFEISKKAGFCKLVPCFCIIQDDALVAVPRDRTYTGPVRGAFSGTLMIGPDVTNLRAGDKASALISHSFF